MIRKFILFFLGFFGFAEAQQPSVGLTLKEAEQRFLKCNLSLLAERYNVDIAQARLLQAGLFDNPVISFEQNVYNRLNGKYFDFGKKGESVVEIEQVIRLAGQRNKQIRKDKQGNCRLSVRRSDEDFTPGTWRGIYRSFLSLKVIVCL